MKDSKKESAAVATRTGGYSIAITLAVIVIAVVLCLFVNMLPESMRVKDMSEQRIYEISDATRETLAALDKTVDITVIAKPADVDVRVNRLLAVYDGLSARLNIKAVDPVYNPTILENQSSDTILVECAQTGRSKAIAFGDIIKYDEYYQYYYGAEVESEFDGEGQLTGAISYVTSEETWAVYTLAGHSEDDLPAVAAQAIAKLNASLKSLNLLTNNGEVPEDCDLLIINAPKVDFAADELVGLLEYMQKGGDVLLLYDYLEGASPNLDMLLRQYGVEPVEGYLMDFESNYYSPYYILPQLYVVEGVSEDVATSDRQILLAAPKGFAVGENLRDGLSVTAFMTTTAQGCLEPYEGAASEEDVSFARYALGAKITDDSTVNGAQSSFIIAPSVLIEPQVLSTYGNLNNLQLFSNCVSACLGARQSAAIPAKSLTASYNTVTGGSFYSILYIFIIPIAVLAAGFAVWLRRRSK